MGYLAELGVDAIWLSPFYPSALADGGYDVADYRDVAPGAGHPGRLRRHGGRGARAPASRSSSTSCPTTPRTCTPGSRRRWPPRPARPRGPATSSATAPARTAPQPPSDWISHFGGPAWTRLPGRPVVLPPVRARAARPELGQPRGPRRLPAHPAVLGRPRRRRLPGRRGARAGQGPVRAAAQQADACWPTCRWTAPTRCTTATRCTRSTPSGARCSTPTTRRGPRWPRRAPRRQRAAPCYARPTGLGQAFNFDLLKADFDAAAYRDGDHRLPGPGAAGRLVLDLGAVQPRRGPARHRATGCPTGADYDEWLMTDGRAAGARRGRPGLRRARAATLFMLALPGSAYLYQGEELGLHEVADLPAEALQDPIWLRTGNTKKGRDGCRVPLPWDADGDSYGFGSGAGLAAAAGRVRPAGGGGAARRSRTPRSSSTGGRCGCAASCRPTRRWSGWPPTPPTCCTSSGPAAGTASPTSAPSRWRCRPGRSGWPAAPAPSTACCPARPRSGADARLTPPVRCSRRAPGARRSTHDARARIPGPAELPGVGGGRGAPAGARCTSTTPWSRSIGPSRHFCASRPRRPRH